MDFFPGAELSIEANPETLTWKKVQLLRSYFTRISVGVQSFDAVLRTSIGRRCSDQALDDALKLVKEAAFPHWNVDLMYALPGESLVNWENDLRLAAGCGADHISCYSLTPESDAVMGSEFTEDDEREAVMFEMAEKFSADMESTVTKYPIMPVTVVNAVIIKMCGAAEYCMDSDLLRRTLMGNAVISLRHL